MIKRRNKAVIQTDDNFDVPSGRPGFRRALLINPPVYDAQYWARWSQPAGLLRIASFLKKKGYQIDFIDCMETNANGMVRKILRRNGDGKPQIVTRDNISKTLWHYGLPWPDIDRLIDALVKPPDEVWITSIMTYWWESTRDMVDHVRRAFPDTQIIVGGIYPTLAPDHARDNLDADIVFVGELAEANHEWTDLDLYKTSPTYAILTTSRGCPWDCHYCAAKTLNAGSNKIRTRTPEDVADEIVDKVNRYGIKRFGFYEDNSLALRGHLQQILELILKRGLRLDLYAPEGFETRMLTQDLLVTMKRAGFEKIYLPFETLRWDTNVNWNRRHSNTALFDQALEAAIRAGFKPRSEEINAFVLFGLPGDCLEDLMDSILYVHHTVGSVIPMLFTPVPGTEIYRQQSKYLHDEMHWDLHNLNGKFLPFLEFNQRRYPNLRATDYLEIEALMSILNKGKILYRSIDLCDDTLPSQAFRNVVAKHTTR